VFDLGEGKSIANHQHGRAVKKDRPVDANSMTPLLGGYRWDKVSRKPLIGRE
jgi:hypothetical protein